MFEISFVNYIDITFLFFVFFSTTLEDTDAFPWWTGSFDSTFSLMSNIFLIVCYIGKCFTTWGWRKFWIIFFLTWWIFVWCFSSRCFSVNIWPRNVSDTYFNILVFLWNIGWFEARYIFFYTGNILIFMTLLPFVGNISCVKLLVDPVQEYFQQLLFDDLDIDYF